MCRVNNFLTLLQKQNTDKIQLYPTLLSLVNIRRHKYRSECAKSSTRLSCRYHWSWWLYYCSYPLLELSTYSFISIYLSLCFVYLKYAHRQYLIVQQDSIVVFLYVTCGRFLPSFVPLKSDCYL